MVDDAEDGEKYPSEEEYMILDGDVALAQAAEVLMAAAEKAELLNDTDSLMKIAGGWMEIHEYLTGTEHHPKKQQLGFVSSKSHEQEDEEEELDDAIAAEGRSSSGIYAQHGKLRIPKSRYLRRGQRSPRRW